MERSFKRMADEHLAIETARTPQDLGSRMRDADVFFIQEDIVEGGGLEGWIAALHSAGVTTAPIIAFSRDPVAESRALARGASGFFKVPSRAEDFWSFVCTWLRMHRKIPRRGESSKSQMATVVGKKGAPRKTATILLVDDSSVIHSFVEETLANTGHRLLHANDGLEGLTVARKTRPDLVISDIDMPNLDGYEMCRRLRKEPATQAVPILILSARGKGVDIDRGFDVGANDFLSKPVSENELLSRIEQVIWSSEPAERRREKILVVDDVEAHRTVVVQALAQQGFQVMTAGDGAEALVVADRTPPDLVITDSEMPEMNGRDLTRELKARERLKDVPVIMLTAADSPLNRLKGKHAGVSAYLTKPFVPDKVVVIAEKLIAERRLLREREAMSYYLSDAAMKAAVDSAAAEGNVSATMRCDAQFVTVLFADIVGFTALTERLSPEYLVTLLNSYFDEMVPIVKAHCGVIDKFIGDAIMAIFGVAANKTRGEAATLAVQAALSMQAALQRFNMGRSEAIQIRVGIHSGMVVMGDIGSRLHRRDYTVIGDTVNIAARVEASGRPNCVLISQSTYDLLRGRFAVEHFGPIKAKGKSAPITALLVKSPLSPDGG